MGHSSRRGDPTRIPPSARLLAPTTRAQLQRVVERQGVPTAWAEDAVQEALITAVSKDQQHDDPVPFVAGIARFKVRSLRRRACHRYEVAVGLVSDLPASQAVPTAPTPEYDAARAEQRALVERVLRQIPPDHATILRLYASEEMTVPEIAANLGITVKAAEKRLARARESAQRARHNLSIDQRRLLKGGPLALLLFGNRAGGTGWRPPRHGAVVVALVAGLALVQDTRVASGARITDAAVLAVDEIEPDARRDEAPSRREPVSAEPTDLRAGTSLAMAVGVTQPRSDSSTEADRLRAELIWIDRARKAQREAAYDRALLNLDMHARLFPAGKIARDRERLRAEVRAAMHAAASASQ